MMKVKMIRNEKDYKQALAQIELLMDATPDSPEEEELDLLAFLIEKYEEEHFPIELPDPVDAIKFRMEQLGLIRKDLIPYLGSQSKVSEVLNRKRPLSLSMMRALHDGLGIPAEVLLQELGKQIEKKCYDPTDYPIKEMFRDGYFSGVRTLKQAKEYGEELLIDLLSPLDFQNEKMVYCKSSFSLQSDETSVYDRHEIRDVISYDEDRKSISDKAGERCIDPNALRAWQARVLQICSDQNIPDFRKKILNEDFLRRIVKLSVFPNGPLLAKQVLMDSGIHFSIQPHLPKTYLDGACFHSLEGKPVIALTLRYDRLDNFWFSLMHELAHAFLHLDNTPIAFFDDIENGISDASEKEENEANQLCMDVLIPGEEWKENKERFIKDLNPKEIKNFASELGISTAIVCGRIRWEAGNYSILTDLLGHGKLRKLFDRKE